MTDLIKHVPLVKVATIRRKDLEQISNCAGLRLDEDASEFFQKETGKDRRALVVIGWFCDHKGNKHILVQRWDDNRLLQQELYYERGKWAAENYPQLFIR